MRTLTHIILRRINNTLRISLPLEFVRKHGLKEGDHAMWIEEKGGVKLKFAKLAVFEKMAAGQQAAEEVALQQEARGD